MENLLPNYIFESLATHGNTIITLGCIKKNGGEKKVLEQIKKMGFECKFKTPTGFLYKPRARLKNKDHLILELIK